MIEALVFTVTMVGFVVAFHLGYVSRQPQIDRRDKTINTLRGEVTDIAEHNPYGDVRRLAAQILRDIDKSETQQSPTGQKA